MPDERMEWALSLDDEISGPGKRMAGALEMVDKKLKRTGDTSEKVSKRMARAAHDAAEAHSFLALQIDALMNIAGRVGGFLERVAHKAYDFGEYAVRAAAFKEDTLTALEAVLGTKKAALEVFKEGVKIAAATPFTTQDVERWQKSLLVGGYTAKETTVLLKALSDVGAFNEFRPDVVDRLAQAMTRLKGEGTLAGDVMRELRGAGVQDARVYAELNKIYGTTAFSLKATREEALKYVDANVGIVAIVRAIAGIGGGLGAMTEKASKNVTGLLSTVASRPFEMLMDLDTTPGYESLRKFLGKMAAVFDAESPTGKKIQAALLGTLSGAFTKVFGNLNDVSEESLVDGITKGIDVIAGLGGAAFAGVGAMLEVALSNTKGLWEQLTGPNREEAFKRITKAAEDFGTAVGKLGTSILKLGGHLETVLGLTNKIAEGWGYITGGAVKGMSIADITTPVNTSSWRALNATGQDLTRRVASTASPGFLEDVFDTIARMPNKSASQQPQLFGSRAQAYVDNGVTSSYVSPVAVRTPARPPVAVKIEVVQHIHGGGNAQQLASEVLQRLRAELPSELLAVFEQLGLEMGG